MVNVDKIQREYNVNKKSIISIALGNSLGYKKVRNILLKSGVILRGNNTIGLRKHSAQTKQMMSISKMGVKNPNYGKCSTKTKKLLAKYRKEIWSNSVMKANIYKKLSETRIAKALSKGKNNPMANSDNVKKWAKSNNIKPNKAELRLYDLIQMVSGGSFNINVKGGVIINGKIPDYIDEVNKKIIELYGDYWHKGDTDNQTQKRIDLFKSKGYDTLIVWERELKNKDKLSCKIKQFIGG